MSPRFLLPVSTNVALAHAHDRSMAKTIIGFALYPGGYDRLPTVYIAFPNKQHDGHTNFPGCAERHALISRRPSR
jgi:hypothetical protein